MGDVILKVIGAVVLVVLTVTVLAIVFTYPLMWAINYTVAPQILLTLFGVAKLGWWKTFCLSFIMSTFFKSSTSE